MRERPILFSGPMVRAILRGTKSMTRRVVKPQPHPDCGAIEVDHYHPTVIDRHGDEQPGDEIFGAYSLDGDWGAKCPYGQPGDRLWVRETWATERSLDHLPITGIPYNARTIERLTYFPSIVRGWHKARPSIHMPRWASRLTLEVTGVRVERVQDISEDDAEKEGIVPRPLNIHASTARGGFRVLWDSLNAKRGHGWQVNPWVWVIEFKRAA